MTKEMFLLLRFEKQPNQQPKPASYTILLKTLKNCSCPYFVMLFGFMPELFYVHLISNRGTSDTYIAQHENERRNNPLYNLAGVKSSSSPCWKDRHSLTLGSGAVLPVTATSEPRWGGSLSNSWGSYCSLRFSAFQSHSFLLCVIF